MWCGKQSLNGSKGYHIVKDTTPTIHAYKFLLQITDGRAKPEHFALPVFLLSLLSTLAVGLVLSLIHI